MDKESSVVVDLIEQHVRVSRPLDKTSTSLSSSLDIPPPPPQDCLSCRKNPAFDCKGQVTSRQQLEDKVHS